MSNTALNATKHGLLSECPVIDGFETQEAWLAHRERFWNDLQPRGAVEEALVERIALTFWRMARLARTEVAAAELRSHAHVERASSFQDPASLRTYTLKAARAEVDLRTRLAGWLAALSDHATADPVPPELLEPFYDWLGRAIQAVADAMGLDDLDGDELLERAQELVSPPEQPAVATIRELLRRSAMLLECPEPRLLETLVPDLRASSAGLEKALRAAEVQVERVRALCQLPGEAELQLFTRYDAHLGRELARLFRTLKDLRAFSLPAASSPAAGVPNPPSAPPPTDPPHPPAPAPLHPETPPGGRCLKDLGPTRGAYPSMQTITPHFTREGTRESTPPNRPKNSG